MLDAYRGRPAVDLEAAVDALVRLSELVAEVDEVREVDLNPVFLLPRGAAVADARVVLG
jgi:acetyltransferase